MRRTSLTPWSLLAVAVLALVPAVVKVCNYPDYPGFDDAFIHLAIVQNLVAGDGWGANPDAPANMTSCPLYTVIMAALTSWLGRDILVGMLLSAALGSAALVLLYRTARLFEIPQGFALSATAFAAFDFVLWRWYGTVMETTMTFFTLGVVLYVYYRWFAAPRGAAAWLALGALLGAAALVRIELLVMGPAIAADLLLNRRRGAIHRLAVLGVGAALAVTPWLAYAWLEFGDVVPTTYYSKTGGGVRLWNPLVLTQISQVVGASHLLPLLLAAVAVLIALRRGQRAALWHLLRTRAALFLAPVPYLGFYYLKTDELGSPARYVLPALYAVPLACMALLHAASPASATGAVRVLLIAALTLHAGINLTIDALRVRPVLRDYAHNHWRVMRESAEYLGERCEPSDRVLVVVDVGILSYYGRGRYRVADAYKLASPELRHVAYEDLIAHVQPAYVVETQAAPEGEEPRPGGRYLATHPDLHLVRVADYAAHGIARPNQRYACRIYRCTQPR